VAHFRYHDFEFIMKKANNGGSISEAAGAAAQPSACGLGSLRQCAARQLALFYRVVYKQFLVSDNRTRGIIGRYFSYSISTRSTPYGNTGAPGPDFLYAY
jgi:hypothetical protein